MKKTSVKASDSHDLAFPKGRVPVRVRSLLTEAQVHAHVDARDGRACRVPWCHTPWGGIEHAHLAPKGAGGDHG